MSTTSTALTRTAESEAQTAIDLAEVTAFCDRIAESASRMGGPGVNRVHSAGRQWVAAIADLLQGHRRLAAEVQRENAQTRGGVPRPDRLLTAVDNADGSTR